MGKLSQWFRTDRSSTAHHPITMRVMRALYDNDILLGNLKGQYGNRTARLLAGWLDASGGTAALGSLRTKLGHHDENVTMVLTGAGPGAHLKIQVARQAVMQLAPGLVCTMGFANTFARQLLAARGVTSWAMRKHRQDLLAQGCEVAQILLGCEHPMRSLACNILESAAVSKLITEKQHIMARNGEFRSLSIDHTYKVALKVIGHSRTQKHNVATIVGLRGSRIALEPSYAESPVASRDIIEKALPVDTLGLVEHVSVDACSAKLFKEMKKVFPNLLGVSLDPHHLCFAVDSHTAKHRTRPTIVGLVMRSVMGKFDVPLVKRAREPLFSGGRLAELTEAQEAIRQHIQLGSMPHAEAKRILKTMDPNTAFPSLTSFMRTIAAVVRLYPDKLDVRHNNTTLRAILCHAASPRQFEWYVNNVRFRSRLPAELARHMASGTTRNEQKHAVLNSHFRQVRLVSDRVMKAELRGFHAAELSKSVTVQGGGLSRKLRGGDMLPVVAAGAALFDDRAWRRFMQVASSTPLADTVAPGAMERRRRRRGPSREQEEIYVAIQARATKRHRTSQWVTAMPPTD